MPRLNWRPDGRNGAISAGDGSGAWPGIVADRGGLEGDRPQWRARLDLSRRANEPPVAVSAGIVCRPITPAFQWHICLFIYRRRIMHAQSMKNRRPDRGGNVRIRSAN